LAQKQAFWPFLVRFWP